MSVKSRVRGKRLRLRQARETVRNARRVYTPGAAVAWNNHWNRKRG